MTKHEPADVRRRQFLEATGRVFLREGLAGVTMMAVAHEAGLSRRLLYDHFPDLRSLLRDYFFDALSRRLAFVVGGGPLQPPIDDGPIEGVRNIVRAIASFDDEQRLVLETLRAPSPSPDLALVGDLVRQNLLARWRAYPQLASMPDDRLLALTRVMLSVILDITDAVRAGVLGEDEAADAVAAIGTAAVAALATG